MFDHVYDTFDLYFDRNQRHLAYKTCMRMQELLVDSTESQAVILEALDKFSSFEQAKKTFRHLASRTFRQPKQAFTRAIESAFGNQSDDTSDKDCLTTLYSPLPKELFVSLASWVFSQGSPTPALSLGEVLMSDRMANGFTKENGTEAEAWESLKQAFSVLAPGAERPINVMTSFYDFLTVYSSKDYSSSFMLQAKTIKDWNCTLEPNENDLKCSPNSSHEHSGCCRLEREVSRSYGQVLEIMKYHILGGLTNDEVRCIQDVKAGLRHVGYGNIVEDEVKQWWPQVQMSPPTLYGTREAENQTRPSFSKWFSTSQGIVHTFNHVPFWNMFKETPAMKEFHDKLHQRLGLPPSLWQPISKGQKFALESWIFATSTHGAHITIHEPGLLADLDTVQIVVFPGKTYSISITPTLMAIDKAVKQLDIKFRDCMLKNDPHDLVLFRNYSYSSCIFECKMRRAVDICGCIPWDYPQLVENGTICHVHARHRFQEIMTKEVTPSLCNCLPDCEYTKYNVKVTGRITTTNEICHNNPEKGIRIAPWHKMTGTPKVNEFQFVTQYVNLFALESIPQAAWIQSLGDVAGQDLILCNWTLSQFALIRVYVAPSTVHVMTRRLRVTFTDQVANIGKS